MDSVAVMSKIFKIREKNFSKKGKIFLFSSDSHFSKGKKCKK